MRIADDHVAEFPRGEQTPLVGSLLRQCIHAEAEAVVGQPEMPWILKVVGCERIIRLKQVRPGVLTRIEDTDTIMIQVLVPEISENEKLRPPTEADLVFPREQGDKPVVTLPKAAPVIAELEDNFWRIRHR
jgi:hypothetical protein